MSSTDIPITLGFQTFSDTEHNLFSQPLKSVITDASQWSDADLDRVRTKLEQGIKQVYGGADGSNAWADLSSDEGKLKTKLISISGGLLTIKSIKLLRQKHGDSAGSSKMRDVFTQVLLKHLDNFEQASLGRPFGGSDNRPSRDPLEQDWANSTLLTVFENASA